MLMNVLHICFLFQIFTIFFKSMCLYCENISSEYTFKGKEGFRFSGAGVRDGREPPDVLGPLREKPALLANEPSLQPLCVNNQNK